MSTGKKGFDSLAALREQLPPGKPVPAAKAEPKGPARAVVRMERKGRGGKEVTVVEHLELPAKELKQALGTGGVVEGELIVLQGDVRPRVEALLRARGVKKVTVA